MEPVLLFIIATLASFIGSLQAGLVNTAVLAHTVQRGPEAGRRMAIGGSIPEVLYAGVAYLFANAVLDKLGIGQERIGMAVGVVLVGMGVYFTFIFKPKFDPERMDVKATGLRRGLVLGLANPQLVLFWCGVVLALHAYGIKGQGLIGMIAFGLGAFTGAILLLFQLVKLGHRAVERLRPVRLRLLFRLVGVLLLISGAVAILR
jgi:threonine/homoserine/homoserine lactone efflux protein